MTLPRRSQSVRPIYSLRGAPLAWHLSRSEPQSYVPYPPHVSRETTHREGPGKRSLDCAGGPQRLVVSRPRSTPFSSDEHGVG